ncbi:MAG: hypothetical protein Q9186_007086 [Xanthomendoza sp. 1 TL-2023]
MTAVVSEGPHAEDVTQDPAAHLTFDRGYGWVCVAACFVVNFSTWGIVSAYGVYLSYYLRHDLFPGATPRDFAFIGGLNFAAAVLVAPLVTYLARVWGTQPPMLFGVVTLATGFVSASFAITTWQLYLSHGTLVGVGVGFTYIPSIPILSQWFAKKRSLANGITSAGSGVGGIVFSLAAARMIESVSLAWSLRITGIVAFILNFLAVVLIKDRNKVIKPSQRPFDTKLLRQYNVWLLLMWSFGSSEVIALNLRRPGRDRVYLYPQIFAGTVYIVASAFLFQLYRRKKKEKARHPTDSDVAL